MFKNTSVSIAAAFRNGLGNFLVFTSVMQALASISEDGKIDLFLDNKWPGREPIELIACNLPFVQNVVLFPDEYGKRQYDQIFHSFHSIFHSQTFEFIHDKERLNPNRITCWPSSLMHELDFYMAEIREQFGYRGKIFPQYMPVADSLPFKLFPGRKIVIANGYLRTSDGAWNRKSYPHFAELIIEILHWYEDLSIYLVGGKDDKTWENNILEKVGKFANFSNRVHGVSGMLNILETARLIQECDFFIGNDSAAMHICDALRKPGLALFGSTLVSKNSPLNGTIIPIRSPLSCSPCQCSLQFVQCEEPTRCMDKIPVGWILGAIRKRFC